MNVPFVDLKRTNSDVRKEVDQKVKEIFDNNAFIQGKNVKSFEQNFAAYCDSKHAVAVSNGTTALELALVGLGIGQGDEVITIPNSFFATTEAIMLTKAKPVFVDMEKNSYTIDVSKVEKAITKKTKAIMPVSLYGQTSDMKPLTEIAVKHNLAIVDDCAQSHGALYHGKKSGSFGTVSCFSFYPTKNLGAFGEAGALVSNDKELCEKLSVLRAHGESPKNNHSVVGYNYRMEEIQGAVLDTKIKYLDKWNDSRRSAAKIYMQELLGTKEIQLPVEMPNRKHVYHLFVCSVPKRDELRAFLEKKGISTAIHYPTPIHLQPAFKGQGYTKGDFPVAENSAGRIVSLPMFPGITEEEIVYVSDSIKEFYS